MYGSYTHILMCHVTHPLMPRDAAATSLRKNATRRSLGDDAVRFPPQHAAGVTRQDSTQWDRYHSRIGGQWPLVREVKFVKNSEGFYSIFVSSAIGFFYKIPDFMLKENISISL